MSRYSEFYPTVPGVAVPIASPRFRNTRVGGSPAGVMSTFFLAKSRSRIVLCMYKTVGEGRVVSSITKRPSCVSVGEAQLAVNDGTLESRIWVSRIRAHRTRTGSIIGGGRPGSRGRNESSHSDEVRLESPRLLDLDLQPILLFCKSIMIRYAKLKRWRRCGFDMLYP